MVGWGKSARVVLLIDEWTNWVCRVLLLSIIKRKLLRRTSLNFRAGTDYAYKMRTELTLANYDWSLKAASLCPCFSCSIIFPDHSLIMLSPSKIVQCMFIPLPHIYLSRFPPDFCFSVSVPQAPTNSNMWYKCPQHLISMLS